MSKTVLFNFVVESLVGSTYHGPKDFLTFGLGPKNFVFPGPHHSLELVVANLVERPN